jgi:hypothetical protein
MTLPLARQAKNGIIAFIGDITLTDNFQYQSQL